MSSFVCKILFKSEQICGCCSKMLRGSLFWDTRYEWLVSVCVESWGLGILGRLDTRYCSIRPTTAVLRPLYKHEICATFCKSQVFSPHALSGGNQRIQIRPTTQEFLLTVLPAPYAASVRFDPSVRGPICFFSAWSLVEERYWRDCWSGGWQVRAGSYLFS